MDNGGTFGATIIIYFFLITSEVATKHLVNDKYPLKHQYTILCSINLVMLVG